MEISKGPQKGTIGMKFAPYDRVACLYSLTEDRQAHCADVEVDGMHTRLLLLLFPLLLACGLLAGPTGEREPERPARNMPTVEQRASPADRDGSKSAAVAYLPDYTDVVAPAQIASPVTVGPFPFQIVLRWQPLTEERPVPWEMRITNTDTKPHVLQTVEFQGYLASLEVKPQAPSAQVETVPLPDGTKRLRLNYRLSLAPGESQEVRFTVTTYLGMTTRGVLLFCADAIDVGNCMALPLEVPTR